ncbi:MAG: hypothetical protein IIA54_04545, partial [Chloroflexi bacterium]|nr:hypothetical protein [Chloroflexota bacterium]
MAGTYAAPDLLADTAWLAEHLGDPGMVIVEMGTKAEEFEAGHIPGAVRCPSAQIKGTGDADPRLVAPPAEAKALFESLGVGDDTLVVAYDRIRNRDASRLWWVLGYYGHANVKVLNGGWKKWTAEGRPAASGPGASGPGAPSGSATFTPAVHPETASTVETPTAAIGRSRTVNLPEWHHVLAEVHYDGKWHYLDLDIRLSFRRKDGTMASFEESKVEDEVWQYPNSNHFLPMDRKHQVHE